MRFSIDDKVKIIDNADGVGWWNPQGEMDKWLGATMTIRDIVKSGFGDMCYKMFEDMDDTDCNDEPGWDWNDNMIEYKVDKEDPPIDLSDPAEDKELNGFILSFAGKEKENNA
jgi:hypothetical protein